MQKQLKCRWVRRVGLLAAILFVLQTNAILCACPSGDAGAMGIVSASSGDVACHGSVPAKTCPCETSDKGSHSSDHGTGTCPDCHSLTACASMGSENIALVSSGPVSPEPGLLTPVALDLGTRLLLLSSHNTPFPTAPTRRARSNPIFVLNSAFLI